VGSYRLARLAVKYGAEICWMICLRGGLLTARGGTIHARLVVRGSRTFRQGGRPMPSALMRFRVVKGGKGEDGLFVANRARIAELAIKNRLPSIGFREYCEAGGVAAYGVDFPHIWRGAGAMVDKILKGTKPADLPIEQATRFELILNLKTAKALDFNVTPAMSARANGVIE
jgi:ABC transporter substrate binding protein